MKRLPLILSLSFAVALGGCASNAVSISSATVVPKTNVLATHLLTQESGTYPVTFKRDTFGPLHATYRIAAFVDGKRVADLGSGEMLRIYLRPGRYVFGVATHASSDSVGREIAVNVTEQYNPVLRLSLVAIGYGGWKITEASE